MTVLPLIVTVPAVAYIMAKSFSDIVALLTIEHQTHMVNLILRLGWEARTAQQEGRMKQYEPSMKALVEELVTYMLFADEEPFPDAIKGNSTFTKTFAARTLPTRAWRGMARIFS